MYIQQVNYLINLLMLFEGLSIILCGYASSGLYIRRHGLEQAMAEHHLIGVILFIMFTNNFIMGQFGLYSSQRQPNFLVLAIKVFLAVLFAFSILVLVHTLMGQTLSRFFISIYAASVFSVLLLIRLFFEYGIERRQKTSFNSRQILLVGVGRKLALINKALMGQKSWGHQVIGYLLSDVLPEEGEPGIQCLGEISDLEQILVDWNVDEVVFALPSSSTSSLQEHFTTCEKVGVDYRIVPAMYDPDSPQRLSVEHIQNIPTITCHTTHINPSGMLYKRTLDYAVGIVGFLLLLCMYPFIALIIKLDSPGPVLFKQPRMGQNGRIFHIFKFRTMHVDAEERKKELMAGNEMQGFMFKIENDPRITRVGRFLRKTSLDEFPQFLNVIRGEMSLVGTRPPTLDEVKQYELWHRRRMSMRPGITGLWQVSGRNKITVFDQIVKLDLQYIDNWRFLDDVIILCKTFWVVLKRKGAK